MAETAKGKKIVYVHPFQRADGSRVPAHERSTPTTSMGMKRTRRTARQASR
jgi:hypothetical protein